MSAPRLRPGGRDDLAAVSALVVGAGLPADGLAGVDVLLVAEQDGVVVGAAALERHGSGDATAWLLRSVVVQPAGRGSGLGRRLVEAALAHAGASAGGAPVALLTETAAAWFARLGFETVERPALPAALQGADQVARTCPASAVAMVRQPSSARSIRASATLR